jgi:hypothetical protein
MRNRGWIVQKEDTDDLLPVCAAFTLVFRLFSSCGVTVQLEFWLDGEVQCVGLSL